MAGGDGVLHDMLKYSQFFPFSITLVNRYRGSYLSCLPLALTLTHLSCSFHYLDLHFLVPHSLYYVLLLFIMHILCLEYHTVHPYGRG